jgi:hypothetical protein
MSLKRLIQASRRLSGHFDVVADRAIVFGMGDDLGAALAVMGTVFVGDPLSLDPGFSIGGASPAVENLLGNLFGLLGVL